MSCADAVAPALPPWCAAGNVPALTAAGIDVCCLANNHSLDWAPEGLLETLDTLHAAGGAVEGGGSCGMT